MSDFEPMGWMDVSGVQTGRFVANKPPVEQVDRRECGWLGCGRPECEPVCAGLPPRVYDPDDRWHSGRD